MDSFYDQPRSAPIPTSIDQIPSSLVPEVSILIPSDLNTSKQKQPAEKNLSYNVWKTQTQKRLERTPKSKCNKENEIVTDGSVFSSQNVSKEMFRKHVRFNSPQVQKQVLELSNGYINGCDKGTISTEPAYMCYNNEKSKTASNMPFEQIYMANIPNRHLDVSIIEPSNYGSKETKAGNGKQENCDKSTNMLLFDKMNDKQSEYRNSERNCKSPKSFCKSSYPMLQKPNYCPLEVYNHQLQPANYKRHDDHNEATIKDLVKVVQQQNEQILLLQKQVSLLLQNQLNQKQVEAPALKENPPAPPLSIRNTEEQEEPQYDQYHNSKEPLSKFAIDVMTSFEVSIRSPNIPHNNLNNECSTSPKIQEITDMTAGNIDKEKINSEMVYGNIKNGSDEDDEVKQNTNLSLILDKPIEIVDRCPSPVNSIHVDMKDYSSDSDDDSHGSSTDIGWTVYNNIMGQVNDLMKKANMQDIPCSSNSNVVTDKTLRKVKEATMRHLQSIGVNLPVVERPNASHRSNETVNGSEYTPTEVSFAVKQLLMKYLPDDQLTKIPHTPTAKGVPENINCKGENLIKRRPEFSFATLQYMQKYNLLNSGTIHQEPQQATKNTETPRILDVTALKQQPKLL